MSTPAIFNPAMITAAPSTANKASTQAPPSSSEASFNNVLNREIADRRSNAQASAPRPQESQGPSENSQAAAVQPPSGDQKAASADRTEKSSKPEAADKEDKTEVADDLDAKQADAQSATEDLLAFVNDVSEVTTASAAGDMKKKESKADVDNTVAEVPEGFVDPRMMMDIRQIDNKSVAKSGEDPTAKRGDASERILAGAGKDKADLTPVDGKTSLAKEARLSESKDDSAKPKIDFATSVNQAAGRQAAKAADATDKPVDLPAAANIAQAGKALDVAAKLTSVELAALKSQDNAAPVNVAAIAPMQQAFTALQAAAGQAGDKLTPNVGSAAWDQALGQKVVWMVAGAQQSATLTLNPPDLGPLQIVLNVSNTDATATFTAAQPEVRQALESAMPRLREMLGEAGIQLGQANVNAGNPNQGNAFANQSSPQSTGRSGHGGGADTGGTPIQVTRIQPGKGGLGMVDTFA